MDFDYITKIGFAPAGSVRFASVDDSRQIAVFLDDVKFTPLPVARGKCVPLEVEGSYRDGVHLFSTKVTVPLSRRVVMPDGPLVFCAVSLSGLRYLVGLDRRPFPVVAVRDSFPEGFSSSVKYGITVSWEGLYPPLEMVVL